MGILSKVAARVQGGTPVGPYECRECDTAHEVEYYTCPDCGSFSVERRATARWPINGQ